MLCLTLDRLFNRRDISQTNNLVNSAGSHSQAISIMIGYVNNLIHCGFSLIKCGTTQIGLHGNTCLRMQGADKLLGDYAE